MRGWIVILLGLLAAPTDAQITRDGLLAMVDAGTDPSLILAVVERDCVDFDIDAEALVALSPRVPKEILQAAIDCRSDAPPPATFECRLYQALTSVEVLRDYPIVLDDNQRGALRLLQPDPEVFFAERSEASGLKARFRAMRDHTHRQLAAADAVRSMPGVRDVRFTTDVRLSLAELEAMQKTAILEACALRATLTVRSTPAGADVFVDDEAMGTTPLELELLPGDYALQIAEPTMVPYDARLTLGNGEERTIDTTLEPRARVLVSSEPSPAVVIVGDHFVGHTPRELFLDEGEHTLRVVAAGHRPFESVLDVQHGEEGEVPIRLERRAHCLGVPLEGSIAGIAKKLDLLLRGTELQQLVPLYRVLSGDTHRAQSATHVVDGNRLFFEPQAGDRYADDPWALIGRDLGGTAFGEVATSVQFSRPGPATVKRIERKKSTIIVETRHQDGATNKVYFDFTRGLDQVTAEAFFEAFCLVFAHPLGVTSASSDSVGATALGQPGSDLVQ